MEFSIKTASIDKSKSACALVPVLTGGKLTDSAKALDEASSGKLKAAIASGDLQGKAGACLIVTGLVGGSRAVLVNCAADAALTDKQFTDAFRAALRAAGTTAATLAVSYLHEANTKTSDLAWKIRTQVLAARELTYRADQWKSKRDSDSIKITRLDLSVAKDEVRAASAELAQTIALADGIDLAKDLGNAPANICTPTFLANTAKKNR